MAAPPAIVAHKPHFHRDTAWKEPVRCATGAAGTLATDFEDGDSAGGVTLATGDRILIKDQAAGAENGIYRVNATGAPTRDYDMDAATEFVGALVYVFAGTLAGTVWRCTNTTAPTIGATAIAFTEFAPGGTGFVSVIDGGKETVNTVAAAGATETLDLADGNVHDVTLTADCVLTFAGATNGVACSFSLVLRQDGTGGWVTTWPGSVVWAGGTAPTLDTTASTVAVLTFFSLDGGTVWYGFPTGGSGGTPAATVTDETTWGIAPAVGTDTEYARQDHTHGTPDAPSSSAVGRLLISDTHSTPIIFGDLLLTEAGDDFLYADA